jgi:hypothetical protein
MFNQKIIFFTFGIMAAITLFAAIVFYGLRGNIFAASGDSAGAEPIDNKKLWGAYVGWLAGDAPAFEAKVGKTMDLQATFVHWGNESDFPGYLTASDEAKPKTLVIFWEAMDYNDPAVDQPRFSYRAILRGDWDDYIRSFAAAAKNYGEPVILIPFEEMNGDWYPWSGTENGNTPAEHIAAYRYLREFFRSAANVKFGWDVNSDSVPDTGGNRIDKYYPGAAYVDYVGLDGFNFGDPWLSFGDLFGSGLKKLAAYRKPIYIFSMACAEDKRKADWIRDALTAQITAYPLIAGWVWFNEKKEKDWRVWSDPSSLAAFRAALPD